MQYNFFCVEEIITYSSGIWSCETEMLEKKKKPIYHLVFKRLFFRQFITVLQTF